MLLPLEMQNSFGWQNLFFGEILQLVWDSDDDLERIVYLWSHKKRMLCLGRTDLCPETLLAETLMANCNSRVHKHNLCQACTDCISKEGFFLEPSPCQRMQSSIHVQ